MFQVFLQLLRKRSDTNPRPFRKDLEPSQRILVQEFPFRRTRNLHSVSTACPGHTTVRMHPMTPSWVLLPALLLVPTLPGADWARFWGPNGTGVAAGPILERPSLEANLLWKTSVPIGHSSPVVTFDKVWLTGIENEKLHALALDRRTGKILWRREAPRPRHSELYENNNPASPTPTTSRA